MRYVVIIERDQKTGSYGAYAPDLPGCGAAADTIETVTELIREAIEFHIEGLRAEGLPVPVPSTMIEYIEVTALQ